MNGTFIAVKWDVYQVHDLDLLSWSSVLVVLNQ